MREFVFWQDALSIHQSAFIRQLAKSCNGSVKLIVWEEVNPQRKTTGWQKPDFGQTQVVVRPSSATQLALLAGGGSNSVHIFSGPRGHPFVNDALRKSLVSNAFIGTMCEAHDGRGLKGWLRLLRCMLDARRLRERINMILGIGQKAVKWYTRSGYPSERIFSFGYFVESPQIQESGSVCDLSPSRLFDLIFVAQLSPWKGWDILLHSLHGLAGMEWRLHVVGDGVDRGKFFALVQRLGFGDSVCFYGIQPNAAVIDLISRSDLLVLPSRWDGWGAVVNEALMCGVPVVCSDRCGAMDLLDGRCPRRSRSIRLRLGAPGGPAAADRSRQERQYYA